MVVIVPRTHFFWTGAGTWLGLLPVLWKIAVPPSAPEAVIVDGVKVSLINEPSSIMAYQLPCMLVGTIRSTGFWSALDVLILLTAGAGFVMGTTSTRGQQQDGTDKSGSENTEMFHSNSPKVESAA